MLSPPRYQVITLIVVLPLISSLAVAARFYVRRAEKKVPLMIDDWSILLGMILNWGISALLIIGAAEKIYGEHTVINSEIGANVVTERVHDAIKLQLIGYIMFAATLGVIKLSVMLLYRRIFVGNFFKRYSLVMCVLICLWSVSFVFTAGFTCGTNLSYGWTDHQAVVDHCNDIAAWSVAFAASDVVTDLLVLATPIPIVWKLQKSRLQKLEICGVFLLGLLAAAAGTVRLAVEIVISYGAVPGFDDIQGDLTILMVWGLVETSVGVVAACLPTIRPLFRRTKAKQIMDRPIKLVQLPKRTPSDDSDLEILATEITVPADSSMESVDRHFPGFDRPNSYDQIDNSNAFQHH